MTRSAIVLLLLVGCGGAAKPASTPNGPDAPSISARKVSLSWGITRAPSDQADVFLALTDETGKQVSHPLGRWPGPCAVIVPAPEMSALTGLRCAGTELHVVEHGGAEIIVLSLGLAGGAPDPMAREELRRIPYPLGAALTVDPIALTTGAP